MAVKSYIGVKKNIYSISKSSKTTDALYYNQCNRIKATTVGNYALFSGGYSLASSRYSSMVEAYSDSLVKTGSLTGLEYQVRGHATTTVGDYAIIAYGANGSSLYGSAITYNKKLTRNNLGATVDADSGRYASAATTVGDYALFGGGRKGEGYGNTELNTVYTFRSSGTSSGYITPLVRTRSELAAATVGDYAIFAGGTYGSSSPTAYTDAYNKSLTRVSIDRLSDVAYAQAATTIGKYALFGGGQGSSADGFRRVHCYDSSLTRLNVPLLPIGGGRDIAATTLGDHALFGGGYDGFYYNYVNSYDSSLTVSTITSLSIGRWGLAATTVGNYALFGGGISKTTSDITNVLDIYESTITGTSYVSKIIKKVHIGISNTSVRIKKAYIGVNNIARLIFKGQYKTYGKINVLTDNTKIGTNSYAQGIKTSSSSSALIYSSGYLFKYNSSLTYDFVATSSNYDLPSLLCITPYYALAGGYSSKALCTYNGSLTVNKLSSLTTNRGNMGAATAASQGIFAGGSSSSSSSGCTSIVEAFNYKLTKKSSVTGLSLARNGIGATSVSGKAIFAGGRSSSGFSTVVESYNSSVTRSIIESLTEKRSDIAATTINGYALFGGGGNGSTIVEVYNGSLTKQSSITLGTSRTEPSATTSYDNYAIFAGGINGYNDVFDIFDTSLTRIIPATNTFIDNGPRLRPAIAPVGNYVIVGGGKYPYGISSGTVHNNYIDVYSKSIYQQVE